MATVHTANSGDIYTPDLGGDSLSLGLLLRRARERRGLTLQEIAKETKLPRRHLEALEQDNLTLLPAGFYQRAEIRTYGQAVGLDQQVLLAKLDSALKPAEVRATPREIRQTARPTRPRSRGYAFLAFVTLAVAVLVYALTPDSQAPGGPALQPEQTEPVGAVSPPPPSIVPASLEQTDAVEASDVSVVNPTETAEAPAPVRSITELVVTTKPAGARVTVNGIAWGTSPVTIRHLPTGDKRIRVTKDGYASQERVLRIDQGRRQTLDIPLESTP